MTADDNVNSWEFGRAIRRHFRQGTPARRSMAQICEPGSKLNPVRIRTTTTPALLQHGSRTCRRDGPDAHNRFSMPRARAAA